MKNSITKNVTYCACSDGGNAPRFLRKILFVKELADGNVLVMDRVGGGRVYEVDAMKLEESYQTWRKMVGGSGAGLDEDLDIEFDDEDFDEDDLEFDDDFDMDGEMEEIEEIEVEGEVNIVDGEVSEDAEGEMVYIRTKVPANRGKTAKILAYMNRHRDTLLKSLTLILTRMTVDTLYIRRQP